MCPLLFSTYPIPTGVQACGVIGGFYLLYKNIMHFEHWDIVVSVRNNWMQVEAVVDFEKGDKVYISEWWKTLANPVRYVIDNDNIYKKEKGKLTISLQEMNALMASVMSLTSASYDKEPSLEWLEIWQQLVNDWRIYKYVWTLEGEPVRDSEWYFCVIDKEDIKKLFRNREDVCQRIFWLSAKDVIVLD